MKPNPDTPPADAPEAAPGRKPRFDFAMATAGGIGYAPKAPGTIGSLAGIAVVFLSAFLWELPLRLLRIDLDAPTDSKHPLLLLLFLGALPSFLIFLAIAGLGVRSASRVAQHLGSKDPQIVVIDEVSGQHLTFLLSGAPFYVYWKFLLLGFILFRVFDICKPWPVRRLEKLPGGWGIMADDWMAGVYAALVLRLVMHLGLI